LRVTFYQEEINIKLGKCFILSKKLRSWQTYECNTKYRFIVSLNMGKEITLEYISRKTHTKTPFHDSSKIITRYNLELKFKEE